MTKFSEVACEVCGVKASAGYAIYRTSPKGPGQPFIGRCIEHVEKVDPVVALVSETIAEGERK